MTKQDLQKELKEKVKEGVKPSDIRKLKRSKSADDIPASPSNQEKQITQLQEQVKFQAQTAANYLKSLQISQAKVSELEERLKNNPPINTELDQSLMARHQNLKDWFTQYSQKKKLDQELTENIDEASEELTRQDEVISQLRGQVKNLELTNQSLTKDLNLATKLAQSRKVSYYSPDNWNHLKYGFYSLIALVFIYWFFKP